MAVKRNSQPDMHQSPFSSRFNSDPIYISQETVQWSFVRSLLHLFWIGQNLCKQQGDVVESLCREVADITQQKAQLVLKHRDNLEATQEIEPFVGRALISFSVQFCEVNYGILYIAPDDERSTIPAMPFVAAQLLAQVCSWLLYTFEQALFLQGQCQRLDSQVGGSLTKREREVLTLMCRGYTQHCIAEKLSISPTTVGKHRQHIYEQLGVHCERDALFAAYQSGLFSILDFIGTEAPTPQMCHK